MMRFTTGVVSLFLAVGSMACESKGSAPAAPVEKAAEEPAEKPAAAEPKIAVSADFEAKADQEITAENYPAQLDALAAEIEAE